MKKKLFKWRSLILTIVLFFLSLQIALSFPVDLSQNLEVLVEKGNREQGTGNRIEGNYRGLVETAPLVEQGKKLYQSGQY